MRIYPGDIIEISYLSAYSTIRRRKYFKVLFDEDVSDDCFMFVDLNMHSVMFYENYSVDEDDDGEIIADSEYISSNEFANMIKDRYSCEFSAGCPIDFIVYANMLDFLRGERRGLFASSVTVPSPEPERTDNSVETTD